MIIEKKAAANDVVSIRIATGEEIVGRYQSETETEITLRKPLVASIQFDQTGNPTLAFMPFLQTADDAAQSFGFFKSAMVMAPVKTQSDIAASYLKMTSQLNVFA